MVLGALGVATSGVFVALSGTSPSTATFFRCLLALPLVWPLSHRERRREGRLPWRGGAVAAGAGALFAGDALLWTRAVFEVGAGLTAVLVNAQVLLVPALALLIDREPLPNAFLRTAPLMAAGIVLTGGVFDTGAAGSAPVRGTIHAILAALCYSGFLFLLRRNGRAGWAVQSYYGVLASAAIVALVLGTLWSDITVTPGWSALGWLGLTAAGSQVCGWLLIGLASPHLNSTTSATLLLLTPVGALALAALVLGERPSPLQLLGCALILASAYAASVPNSSRHQLTGLFRRLLGSS
ncbi:EamA-like transporter family protein [Actinopolyspora xinjiangensis]|uniref:EamA-like transporter family protein n=2 Tax=Actinopolyspora xinjiangensis TaxID=405564 RepID=A0A1H0RGT5_9ACTN|nr:EamA-like transporter family protein [Actinopolyspora xinjiangensis]